MGSFTPIGDALQDRVGSKSIKKSVDASMVIDAAEEVFEDMFGEEQAFHANPQFLKNRTLTVTCTSSTMAQEIRLKQKEIVNKINEKLDGDKVDRIRYLT